MKTSELLTSVFLSILSSPVKIGIYRNLESEPGSISGMLNEADSKVQDYIGEIYGDNPVKAAERIIEKCIKKSIKIVSYWSSEYPPLLKEIHRPPLVLYAKGNLNAGNLISIVGTRNSDRLSEDITLRISSALASSGMTVVSGMAYGIDRFAHLGALNSGGGTVGVLPGGIDGIYPYRNRDIYEMIENSGLSGLVSEYPPSIPSGQKWTFAQRNRIISGLSRALIVIQAPKDSGAMITAKYAIEQNRELFVCPGNSFDPKYEGCHELLRDGAAIISSMDFLIREIVPGMSIVLPEYADKIKDFTMQNETSEIKKSRNRQITPDFSGYGIIEKDILINLTVKGADIDSFIRTRGYSADEVNSALISLEIEGIITRKGNNIYLK